MDELLAVVLSGTKLEFLEDEDVAAEETTVAWGEAAGDFEAEGAVALDDDEEEELILRSISKYTLAKPVHKAPVNVATIPRKKFSSRSFVLTSVGGVCDHVLVVVVVVVVSFRDEDVGAFATSSE